MKSSDKLNKKIYDQIAEEFGVNPKVVEQVVKSQWILLKREIENDDCWGKISFRFWGKFTVQPSRQKQVKDKPLKKITKYE